MTDAELAALSGDELLDRLCAAAAWGDPDAGVRAELLRRLADRDRLAGVVRRALDSGHCHPAAGSDPGEVLVLHCGLTLRDLIALRETNARLLESLAAIRQAAARPQGGRRAALEQIVAATTAALAADEG